MLIPHNSFLKLNNRGLTMNQYVIFIFSASLLFLNACGGGSSSKTPSIGERGGLISSKLVSSKQTLLLPYKVDAYKIIYSTVDTNNSPIRASGLLTIPQKNSGAKSPLLSYQHGTIFLNNQAPSISATSIYGIMTLSGTGFIVSAPDYIGYGESAAKMHPYIHADSLANTSIDMLRASKKFLHQHNIKTNSQLFLTGYSEGGYATLALQKKLQESHGGEFTVTASAAAAGPFDLSETTKILANRPTNLKPAFMNFALKSYNDTYKLNKISEMYQAPFVSVINTHFDGNHSSSSINANLSHTTSNLFNAPFLSTLQGKGQHVIKDKLALNNIYDWKPTAPIRFYHSQNDEIVPYSNSQKALDTMTNNGASNISLVDCPLDTHTQCAISYVLDTLNFFLGYANDL